MKKEEKRKEKRKKRNERKRNKSKCPMHWFLKTKE